MLSQYWTTLLIVASINPASCKPRVPDPLPSIAPADVVNLLIQDADDGPGDLVASVIAADSTAATYLVECATAQACGFAAWDEPIIMTQGLSFFQWSYAETTSEGLLLSEVCTFDGTTASIATCTNSYSYVDYGSTTQNALTTLVYDGRLATDSLGHSVIFDSEDGLNGPPPFIPVKITAGLASLSAFNKAVTTGSIPSTSTSGSSTQASASPTITSLAKSTSSTGSTASSSSIASSSVATGNTTAKGNAAQCLRVGWEWGAVLAVLIFTTV